jgi:hypothetical protein
MPFVGNHHKAMPKGLTFHLDDYLELIDWTGRTIRDDKKRRYPADAAADPAKTQPRAECLVAFDDTEDDDLPGIAPAPFPVPGAAKRGFIAFQFATERLPEMLFMGHAGPDRAIETFRCRHTGNATKTLPINWNAKIVSFQGSR